MATSQRPACLPVAPRIRSVDNADMSIEAWWPKLRLESREYLIANNGDVVPAALVAEITAFVVGKRQQMALPFEAPAP